MKPAWMLLLLLGCARASAPRPSAQASWPLAEAPKEWQPEITHALESMAELQQVLMSRLMAALEQGDVASAVEVCRKVAQPLSRQTAQTLHLKMGRTSFRLRNPENAPPAWARAFVLSGEGRKAADVPGRAWDLGDRVGVLRPIPTANVCLSCHGEPGVLSPAVSLALEKAYPNDAARGFREGDLRGFFWAEVQKTPGSGGDSR